MTTSSPYLELEKCFVDFGGDPLEGMGIIKSQFNLFRLKNVYHYTDVGGFISIMKNKELWASHIAFMNDHSEYLHGKEMFREKLAEKIKAVSTAKQRVLQQVMDSLDREKSDYIFPTSSKDVFSISFSYNRDSLEMWRGYGKESGIAIGFDYSQCHSLPGLSLIREELYEILLEEYGGVPEKVCPKHNRLFFPISVLYEDEKKQELVRDTIEMGLTCFEKQSEFSEDVAVITASDFLSDLIFRINPLLKHRGFAGEDECRFVDNYVERDDEKHRIHYRNRGGIVLPYVKYKMVDLNCRPIQILPVHEIIIGPGLKQNKVADSVKYFLAKSNMEYLVDKVVLSDIPYIET